ncbi:ORF91 [Helicoverpa armigera SNPV]|uniref:ORF92 n=2 Tax=Alphabaculovirus helarmigerae TaxID=3047947 RepID=Q8V5R3_9ABAC|nr:ORF92 [Helicoverpa zea single nucleopolyhedrovirus]AIG63132.1 ORF91 [Helicoverpa SNPV AC53]AIG63270.1 ORF91 [Helicoverpa armigera SNPV]AHN05467.1 ORF92 [Helicoverpa zea single nucleopolyhedrovirus]AKN50565.1 P40 [Helicoverpa zea single nucleopolyhedrovirus]
MSGVMLFLEIENMKNKIDRRMNMSIWPKFFPLLVDANATLDLTLDELVDFLVTTARIAEIDRTDNNAALASQYTYPPSNTNNTQTSPTVEVSAQRQPSRGNLLNLFRTTLPEQQNHVSSNLTMLRSCCQRLLQHYTLNSTTSNEFYVKDIVACMIYLNKTPQYKPLFQLLETTMSEDYECMPAMSPIDMQNIVALLKNLLELPTSIIDFTNVKMLKITLGRVMNYPISRFPKIMLMQSSKLTRDKRCTIEELIMERADVISKLEPQCTNGQESKIPYCQDSDFIEELVRLMDDFSLQRMFYNAANSLFYTTMENYAVANCKFAPDDYNNIFKSMDNIREYSDATVTAQQLRSDSLNVQLTSTSSKRRRI